MSHPNQPAPPPQERYDLRVRNAIIEAYYNRVVAAADVARTRAQSAYAIASAIAGVVVGASLLSNLARVPTWVKLVGAVALTCWLLASALYIRAVSRTVPLSTGPQPDADALVAIVMKNVNTERKQIERWQNQANRASLIAMFLTAVAFVLALLLGPMPNHRHGTVALTSAGMNGLGKICGRSAETISGDINVGTLMTEFIEIKADAESCNGKRLTLRIAKTQILTVAS